MPKRRELTLRKDSRALKVLSAIISGAINISVDVAGDLGHYPSVNRLVWRQGRVDRSNVKIDLNEILRDSKKRYKYQLAVEQLRKRRYAKLDKRGGKWVLTVTEKGERRIRQLQIHSLSIQKPKKWDGKWRIVLFDIPEKYRFKRTALREQLKALGFLQFQKSAFVLPYPCADELDATIQYLEIDTYVTFFTTDSLGYQEAKALYYFKLERQ